VRRGCRAAVTTVAGAVRASAGWLGRVVNALGEPIDGEGALLLGPSPAARSFSCPEATSLAEGYRRLAEIVAASETER
jgi:flagellum-specific ATP synthase